MSRTCSRPQRSSSAHTYSDIHCLATDPVFATPKAVWNDFSCLVACVSEVCTRFVNSAQQSETSCIKPRGTHLSQVLCCTIANCLHKKSPTTRCHNALLRLITRFSKMHLGAGTLPQRLTACHNAVASSPGTPIQTSSNKTYKRMVPSYKRCHTTA